MIVVDTLRPDHVGAYGYGRDVSPAVDALADDSVRFERAYSVAPWTQPSVATMITGLYPSSHKVDRLLRILPESADTLAEVLGRAGYVTGSAVTHWLIGSEFGFDQGCDFFLEGQARGGPHAVTSLAVSNEASQLLEVLARDERPFFLLVHLFDPHYAYTRHPEYGFAKASAGRLSGGERIEELRALKPPPDEEEKRFVRDLYDEEIRYTDTGIEKLLGALRRLGLYDDTLIVFAADHGEEFFERGWVGHTRTLYDELIRVPLLIRLPGSREAGRVVDEAVSLVSLMPSLLDLMGVDRAGLSPQGPSFAPLLTGKGRYRLGALYSEVDRYSEGIGRNAASEGLVPREMILKHAIVSGRFKLIVDRLSGERELYDLERDPQERENLAGREPEVVQTLAEQLAESAAEAGSRPLARVGEERIQTQEEEEMLRQLGYISP
jgi:arylsulfatase A-like enzyme